MNLDTSPAPSLLANRDEIPEPIPVNSRIYAAVTSIINEKKEKDKRKLNIIVHNLPESNESDPKLRKSYDITKSTSIIGKYLEKSVTISQAIRIGKREIKLVH